MKFPKVEEEIFGVPESPLVRFTHEGRQVLESTPKEVPLGWNAPETMEMMIARMVRQEVSNAAGMAGYETLEEAYNFDTDGDDSFEDHLSPHEIHAMVNAPEMKPEYPDRSRRKETESVRERAESGAESVSGASERSGSADGGSQGGGAKETTGNGKVHAGAHHAPADSDRGIPRDREGAGKR